MAFERPTLAVLIDRVQADFVSRLGGSGPPLRRSVVHVFARVVAGAVHMLYGFLEYLARQLFPDISDGAYLVRQAGLFGFSLAPATFASGVVVATGTNGVEIPDGTRFARADGALYISSGAVTIASGTADVSVTAELAGVDGNLDEGAVLTFESPIENVDATALVDSAGVTGGTDQEEPESLRARLLARLRETPQGGAENDYVVWALGTPGVTRAWVSPSELGAGTVVVRFMRDDDPTPVPSVGEVADVQTYIDARRPVTATVTVLAPVAKTWLLEITLTIETTAILADVRAAIEAEVIDLFRTGGGPGETLPLSKVRTAIGNAEGVEDYIITAINSDLDNGDPNLEHGVGEIPVLDSIVWN